VRARAAQPGASNVSSSASSLRAAASAAEGSAETL
jgi:hypothetical protein